MLDISIKQSFKIILLSFRPDSFNNHNFFHRCCLLTSYTALSSRTFSLFPTSLFMLPPLLESLSLILSQHYSILRILRQRSSSLFLPFVKGIFFVIRIPDINPLNTKRRLLYLKIQFVPRSKHFSSRL